MDGSPYNGLYGVARPERGTFFTLQVYKSVGISQVSERASETCMYVTPISSDLR